MRLRESEFATLLSPGDWVASCHDAYLLVGRGSILNPPRQQTVEREGNHDLFRLRMSAEWRGRYIAEKVIEERSDVRTGRLGHRTAVILLEDLIDGTKIELEADLITDMRTGAAGALGARYLGPTHPREAAILGTGRIARALAVCVDSVFPLHHIRFTSRSPERRKAFADDLGPRLRAPLLAAESVRACAAGADIVFAAVPTAVPILRASDLEPGAHLSVMGGDARTTQIGTDILISRPVVVDSPEQAVCSGEFRSAQETGHAGEIAFARSDRGDILTVADADQGRLEHLRGTGAIAYFTGLAAQDLHAAATVYEKLRGIAAPDSLPPSRAGTQTRGEVST